MERAPDNKKAADGTSLKSTSALDDEESFLDDDDDDDLSTAGSVATFCSRRESQALRNRIIKEEDRAVRNSRWILIAAIVIATVCTSIAVYVFASNGDLHSFELEYEGYVTDIINLVQWEVQYNFALMQQLSAALTNTALVGGIVFPNFTDPSFEVIGGYADGMGGIMLAGFCPLVKASERKQWEEYAHDNQEWLEESKILKVVHPGHRDALHGTIQDHEHDRRRRRRLEKKNKSNNNFTDLNFYANSIHKQIYRWENGTRVPEEDNASQVFAPLWQVSPADASAVNVNMLSDPRILDLYNAMIVANHSVISAGFPIGDLFDFQFDATEKHFKKHPHGFLLEPVYDSFKGGDDQSPPKMVGFLIGLTSYRNLVTRLLPPGAEGIVTVFEDTCGNDITFELNGPNATFLGYEDMHVAEFDRYRRSTRVELYNNTNNATGGLLCVHDLHIYPTSKFRDSYNTNKPVIYTAVVALAFLVTAVVLLVYDRMVTKRQNKTMENAVASNKVVSSLFPEAVRERLLIEKGDSSKKKNNAVFGNNKGKEGCDDQFGGVGALTGDDYGGGSESMDGASSTHGILYKKRPIAEFYPNTTIMFADIVGFTAWSSTREPFQVFLLLETIFSEFDAIAKRRRVFKVETVGDCYVAVAGLPTPRRDHAQVMARFATDIRHKMKDLTNKLEVALGPDTTDLSFRIGLHSGPVTGGVLRGNNARYQLFGDSMNTAARMESTGQANKIQVSSETAELLVAAGKAHWLIARETKVHAKGKGELDTYWLVLGGSSDTTSCTSTSESLSEDFSNSNTQQADEPEVIVLADGTEEVQKPETTATSGVALTTKDQRLVDWNTTILLERIKAIVVHREKLQQQDSAEVGIPLDVMSQLHSFCTGIATMYKKNAFHNFEHASHVTMSTTKLLARVARVDTMVGAVGEESSEFKLPRRASQGCDNAYTRDITSDPLTQFAVIFSALIHDVDHSGVPNATLILENSLLAATYENKSVAENNSIAVAWQFLMQEQFRELVDFVCPSQKELKRLHELIVNIVLATDIADKELKAERNVRWDKVFNEEEEGCHREKGRKDLDHLKATIVIEHLIQASDVCHTMQHWHVFRKWNERLFSEMYNAYINGRADKNPADFWYQGEIGFFDYYIIPLAKKLDECRVFGVSSDELLNYAQRNRSEWEQKGKEVVEMYKEKYCHEQHQQEEETDKE